MLLLVKFAHLPFLTTETVQIWNNVRSSSKQQMIECCRGAPSPSPCDPPTGRGFVFVVVSWRGLSLAFKGQCFFICLLTKLSWLERVSHFKVWAAHRVHHESEYTQVFNVNLTVEVILTPDFRWLFGKPFVYRSYDANFKREEPFAIFWEWCLSYSSVQNRKAYICTASLNYCGVIFAAKH